jgi:hypothetical protein
MPFIRTRYLLIVRRKAVFGDEMDAVGVDHLAGCLKLLSVE